MCTNLKYRWNYGNSITTSLYWIIQACSNFCEKSVFDCFLYWYKRCFWDVALQIMPADSFRWAVRATSRRSWYGKTGRVPKRPRIRPWRIWSRLSWSLLSFPSRLYIYGIKWHINSARSKMSNSASTLCLKLAVVGRGRRRFIYEENVRSPCPCRDVVIITTYCYGHWEIDVYCLVLCFWIAITLLVRWVMWPQFRYSTGVRVLSRGQGCSWNISVTIPSFDGPTATPKRFNALP